MSDYYFWGIFLCTAYDSPLEIINSYFRIIYKVTFGNWEYIIYIYGVCSLLAYPYDS